MDALLLSAVTQTVRSDFNGLVHTATAPPATLIEAPPPSFRWGIPLGFASLAAAGLLLVAAGGLQTRVQDRVHHRTGKTRRIKRPLKPRPEPTPWSGRYAS
jgi:hypothetical protein